MLFFSDNIYDEIYVVSQHQYSVGRLIAIVQHLLTITKINVHLDGLRNTYIIDFTMYVWYINKTVNYCSITLVWSENDALGAHCTTIKSLFFSCACVGLCTQHR